MEPNAKYRNKLFAGILGIDVFLVCFIMLMQNISTGITIYGHWLSIFIGVGFGTLTCLYLQKVWDPVLLQLKDPNAKTADSRWMPIAAIGGIIFARLVLAQMSPGIGLFFMNIGLTWVITWLSYMGFQAWWHRPK